MGENPVNIDAFQVYIKYADNEVVWSAAYNIIWDSVNSVFTVSVAQ